MSAQRSEKPMVRHGSITRTEKISKLGNAIIDYRGCFVKATGKWIRPPQPKSIDRIYRWLDRLNIDRNEITSIDAFASFEEYRKWIGAL